VPGLVDLSDLASESDGVAKTVLESVQEMLLKLALQMARDDYEIRRERQRQGLFRNISLISPFLRFIFQKCPDCPKLVAALFDILS
jgi:hypothetical protein